MSFNFTRDPFYIKDRLTDKNGNRLHPRPDLKFTNKMADVEIRVNGIEHPSHLIRYVYRHVTSLGKSPWIEVFETDKQGNILEQDGKPISKKIEGKVEVIGEPETCGCWRGKRKANWWRNLNERRPGW